MYIRTSFVCVLKFTGNVQSFPYCFFFPIFAHGWNDWHVALAMLADKWYVFKCFVFVVRKMSRRRFWQNFPYLSSYLRISISNHYQIVILQLENSNLSVKTRTNLQHVHILIRWCFFPFFFSYHGYFIYKSWSASISPVSRSKSFGWKDLQITVYFGKNLVLTRNEIEGTCFCNILRFRVKKKNSSRQFDTPRAKAGNMRS